MKKQKQKAQITRMNIEQAAAALFVENGYEATSVNDIVGKAGCSVGAFYGHFKSKQELANALWLSTTTALIHESTEKGAHIPDRVELVEYLVACSSRWSRSEQLMSSLYPHCHLGVSERDELTSYASRYLSMVKNALAAYAPGVSEDTLWAYASLIHNLINSYAMRNSRLNPWFSYNPGILRKAILALMEACRKEGQEKEADSKIE